MTNKSLLNKLCLQNVVSFCLITRDRMIRRQTGKNSGSLSVDDLYYLSSRKFVIFSLYFYTINSYIWYKNLRIILNKYIFPA